MKLRGPVTVMVQAPLTGVNMVTPLMTTLSPVVICTPSSSQSCAAVRRNVMIGVAQRTNSSAAVGIGPTGPP